MEEKSDHLCLAGNSSVQKMLQKNGQNTPNAESVIFSDFVVKINKRDKEQTRVLLITNKAVYNLMPNNYGKCKRRIGLEVVASVTASSLSDEWVLHVPDEYDYRFKSAKKDTICDLLTKLYRILMEAGTTPSKRLAVTYVAVPDLKEKALTKEMARLQTREDIMRRKQQLAEEMHDSDKEDDDDMKGISKNNNNAGPTTPTNNHNGNNSVNSATPATPATSTNTPTQQSSAAPASPSASTPASATDESVNSTSNSSSSSGGSNDEKEITQLMEGTEKVRLEDFELLKVLGRGSFGKVMQVRKKSDGKIYAMKILKKKAIIARNQVEHTKAERKILQALSHPFLMTLRYAFQSREKLYFVLDYYQGGELFFHLKQQRRFPEDVARIYIAEIALAMGHLHGLGVIYRDLKPENILLDDNGHVCLTDFGLSKDMDPADKAHTFCGTPEYLAPEIVTGAGHDKAVDWWSLGILLYELTVGIPPFYSQNVNEMYNKIQHGVLRFPPFLTEPCKSLIVGLLNRDPKKRLGSMNDITDITEHAFFRELDFAKLMKKEVEVSYKPKVKGNDDTSNFDPSFTAEPVVDSVTQSSTLTEAVQDGGVDSAFKDFTFNPKGDTLLGQD